ncbi:3'-5' exonuclease [Arsenophonus nasoniae]|uniref:3'-5' exoribonuclease n=1 Tax=Arsenophonus nasoniae TaxID=638 RepID=A0AA95GDZ3_9GAMM|nr:3'-5' exonuclease [Arsenophonus nasoniae]WGL95323.1 3'-5' exoribonuclease [Arsenophonus nasoniae]
MNKFSHLMIDLETMGTRPTAAILSIGAVFFDPESGLLGDEFYERIDLNSVMQHKETTVEADTIKWWLTQSSEARREIVKDGLISIQQALARFSGFITLSSVPDTLKVWGNGATFDNIILRSTYERFGFSVPWRWFNDRDVRTAVEFGRCLNFDPKRDMPFEGIQHNALADAKHQAKYLSTIWKKVINNEI